jgi:hypothetical protein
MTKKKVTKHETKRGQAAIDYWANKMRRYKTRITVIGVIIAAGLIYAFLINTTSG